MELRGFAKTVAALGDRVWPAPAGITVLIYHRVGGGSGGEVDLDVDAFRAQLAHLAEHHRVLPLDEAVAELADPDAAPSPGVVITFDDGTADFCDHAVPALVDAGLPATLYVATRFVDEGVEFPWGAPPATWAGLADAASTGLVTIGSHTHSHALLDRADDASQVAPELDRSIESIGEHIGAAPEHFAYPKALGAHADAEAAVRSRFRSAALASSRVNVPGRTDLHRIWRTPIQRSDHTRWFEAKAAGGLRLEGELRGVAARIRYRRASV